MSDPTRKDEAKALALAILEINRILALSRDTRRQGPAPETVTA